MTEIRLGPFGFGIPRPESVKLKRGENIIIAYWSWRKFGYIRKLISIDVDNNVSIQPL